MRVVQFWVVKSGFSNLVAEVGDDPLVMLLIASPWTIVLDL
jgi:hypothetical protein